MGIFLLCTFLMIILYPVGIDLYLVAVPQIADALQASEAQIHTAFSIYLFGMAATVLLGGIIADRHGRRWVVLGGAIIFVIASLVAANAAGIRQFYLGRFWQGVGAGALYIMTFTVLRDVLSQGRLAMALSMINGVICVIPVLAPVLGYLILSHFDWRGIFVAMALVAAFSGSDALLQPAPLIIAGLAVLALLWPLTLLGLRWIDLALDGAAVGDRTERSLVMMH